MDLSHPGPDCPCAACEAAGYRGWPDNPFPILPDPHLANAMEKGGPKHVPLPPWLKGAQGEPGTGQRLAWASIVVARLFAVRLPRESPLSRPPDPHLPPSRIDKGLPLPRIRWPWSRKRPRP